MNIESKYYFLIAFLILWGGGMLWGIVLIINHLRKSKKALQVLKAMQFEPLSNNPGIAERIKDIVVNTVCKNFTTQMDALRGNSESSISAKNIVLKFEYNSEAGRHNLPRPIGFRERIQLISRTFTLKKIYYKANGSVESFYAETVDAETVRHFRNRREKRSNSGWILCVSGNTGYSGRLTIHPKFSGSAKVLMTLAYKIADIEPISAQGLLPEFEEYFGVKVESLDREVHSLDEKSQLKILPLKDSFLQDTKLVLDPRGVWLLGSSWPDPDKFKSLVLLCYALVHVNN
ncbi:MAG TPA: hypothetical protein ENG51_11050 [Deltaproteobacteria bacterium]|nr:hypothetical protein [Deltaproteobacteria bacterium]